MSECDFSYHPVSVAIVDFFPQTAAQICFKFCVDVPWVDLYKFCINRGALPIFH